MDNATHGLWARTAPPAPVTTSLEGTLTAEVAIVGAGYTGLSAALYLAQRGAAPVVLEASTIGFGAAGRSSGLVNAGMWVPPDDVPSILGAKYGERLLQLLADAPRTVCELIESNRIDCELERYGTLQCAIGSRGLTAIRKRAEQWTRRGADVVLLDAAETARKVGSSVYQGAIFDKRTSTLQPLAYVRGLAKAAIGAGAQVFTDTQVLRIERGTKRWCLHTPRGCAQASWVFVATDAYTCGPWPRVQRQFAHLPYFNIATRPLEDRIRTSILPERQGITDTRTILSSVRLDQSGRLIIGSIGALRGSGARIHVAWAKRALQKWFPQVGSVDLEYAWSGTIGMTDTHLPKFHQLAPQVLSIGGYNGRGIAAGTVFGRLVGQLIAREITEYEIPLPVTEPEPIRFRSLRSHLYEAGARSFHFTSARL